VFFNADIAAQHRYCVNLWKAHEAPSPSALLPMGAGAALGFVVVVRNPVDMILGAKFDWGLLHQNFQRGIDSSNYHIGAHSTLRTAERVNQSWHQWMNAWPSLPLLVVRYEDLVAQPHPVLRRVLQFLGYEHSELSLNRSVAANPFRVPHPEPSVAHFELESLQVIDDVLGYWIDTFGYRTLWERQRELARQQQL
jgi:Sulfotransferase family